MLTSLSALTDHSWASVVVTQKLKRPHYCLYIKLNFKKIFPFKKFKKQFKFNFSFEVCLYHCLLCLVRTIILYTSDCTLLVTVLSGKILKRKIKFINLFHTSFELVIKNLLFKFHNYLFTNLITAA